MSEGGWIKIHRKMLKNPVVMKDADHLAVWMWLLMNATAFPKKVVFHGKETILLPGELTTGRKIIASELLISESKVQRILKEFENAQQIEQQTDHKCRLISICSWVDYQMTEQQNEQQVNNCRTTGEQLVNTKKEIKKEKKVEKENYSSSIEAEKRLTYINEIRQSLGLPIRQEVYP